MGQIFCKDCHFGVDNKEDDGALRKSAVVSFGKATSLPDDSCSLSSLKSSPADPRRSKRIHHKKRTVVLHAEFRDKHGVILAPPLCCQRVMEDTDNVFCGQDLGVDNLTTGSSLSSQSLSVESGSVREKDERPSEEKGEAGPTRRASGDAPANDAAPTRPRREKSHEENASRTKTISSSSIAYPPICDEN